MSKRAIAWGAAGLVLAVSPIFAAPPLGCLENSRGARWCTSYDNDRAEAVGSVPVLSSGPHPATIKKPPRPFEPVGAIVKPIRITEFLPDYFVPRAVHRDLDLKVVQKNESAAP